MEEEIISFSTALYLNSTLYNEPTYKIYCIDKDTGEVSLEDNNEDYFGELTPL